MSRIERYNREKHLSLIQGWSHARGLIGGDDRLVPPTGFVVNGIAVGWVFLSDGKVAHIEGILADPASTKEARSEALDILLETLFLEAERKGYLMVVVMPSRPEFVPRVRELGYEIVRENCAYGVRRTALWI